MKYQKSQRTTFNARPIASVLAALVVSAASFTAFAAPDYGKCEVTGQRGSVKLETAVPGTLSVRPVLPSPGWWNGDSIDTIKDGFEYCMAANMAYRAGLDRVVLVNRSFAQILTGQAQGFDIALSQITITDERKKVVNFTDPYFSSDQGILVKAGVKVDKESIKKLRLGVKQGTTILGYLAENVKPVEQPKVFAEAAAMYAALAAGQVDARLAAGVDELHEDACAFCVDGIGDLFPALNMVVFVDSRTARITAPALQHVRRLRDQQRARRCTLAVVLDHHLARTVVRV